MSCRQSSYIIVKILNEIEEEGLHMLRLFACPIQLFSNA